MGKPKGYTTKLGIDGIGYCVAVQGNVLRLDIGYSHEAEYIIPNGVSIKCEEPTTLVIIGTDRRRIEQVVADIRAFHASDPYKDKGSKYNR